MNGNVETTCWTSVDDVDQVGDVYTGVRRRSYSTSSWRNDMKN